MNAPRTAGGRTAGGPLPSVDGPPVSVGGPPVSVGGPLSSARAVVVLASVALLSGLLTGCAGDSPGSGCGWMEAQSAKDDADAIVVLVDGSRSVRGTGANARGVDYAETVGNLLEPDDKTKKKDDEEAFTVSIGTFGGPTDVDWVVDRRSADWRGSNPNPKNQEENRKDANDCLRADLAKAQQAVPAEGGTDILGALSSAAEKFREVKGERRLVVLSDGLSTTGCANLTGALFGSPQEIASITSVCGTGGEGFGELPDLSGVRVSLLGLGHSAAGQPSATPAQRTWLRELWTGLLKRAGAQDPEIGSDAGTQEGSRAPSGSGDAPADPVVPYTDGRTRTIPLGTALFDTGSARVRDEAMDMLSRIAVQARTTPGLDRVVINGYVDPRGGTANDVPLSRSRAQAVGEVLVDHGVPADRVRPVGRGRAPDCPEKTAGQGTHQERLQCDRRVDIQIIRK